MADGMNTRWPVVMAVPVGIGLSVAASTTDPFTTGADIVATLGFIAVVVALPLRSARAPTDGADGWGTHVDEAPRWRWRWAVVVAPLVLAVAWELFCFAHGPRDAYPTLSSILDGVDASRLGKGISFAAWLGLGWALVTW
jgi:hypothetical protein